MKKLRMGVIGMSEGNGHPYSWSAIFNGYDPAEMRMCPFPAISDYLSKRRFPEDAIATGRVTHVWTQDQAVSRHIAAASRIPNVVREAEAMIGEIDALLLARDDAENHLKFAAPFLDAGIPVYVDKPFALNLASAEALLSRQCSEGQIFSCTALRYSQEFTLNDADREALGEIVAVDATTPKSWAKYAVHIIEPTLRLTGLRFKDLSGAEVARNDGVVQVSFRSFTGVALSFTATGARPAQIVLDVRGTLGRRQLVFADAFTAFRTALQVFVDGQQQTELPIPREETLDVVRVIETGLS
jgi:predicted dehydrogenase